MRGYWWVVILIVVGSVTGLTYYSRTVGGRYVIDTIKIKSPVVGPLFQKIYMARFARNLSTLIAGGIPIVKALDAVADIVGNVGYIEIIIKSATHGGKWKRMPSPLQDPS